MPGQVSPSDAAALLSAGMTAAMVRRPPDPAAVPLAKYAGYKGKDYVYFFPPIQYDDGEWCGLHACGFCVESTMGAECRMVY